MKAREIAVALGGQRAGNCWMARCPSHDDSTPSFAITETKDGKVLVRCHAGCEQQAVIEALRERGLWGGRDEPTYQARGAARAENGVTDETKKRQTVQALQIWCEARPAAGTPAETYLRSRGIVMTMPTTLRFHPSLKHPLGVAWPALVGLVTLGNRNVPVAVHRTFLARDGKGKAPLAVNKMMLGPCRGGAVRLASLVTTVPLMIGEGIETCLAAMQATGSPVWAALSTSGLRSLELPGDVRDVTILADGDPPGEAAAVTAAARWARDGRRVRIARPPAGCDFNDLLVGFDPVGGLGNVG